MTTTLDDTASGGTTMVQKAQRAPKLFKTIQGLKEAMSQVETLRERILTSKELTEALQEIATGNPTDHRIFYPAIFRALEGTTLVAENRNWTSEHFEQLKGNLKEITRDSGLAMAIESREETTFVPTRQHPKYYTNTTPPHQETDTIYRISVDLSQDGFFTKLAEALKNVRKSKIPTDTVGAQRNEQERKIDREVNQLMTQFAGRLFEGG